MIGKMLVVVAILWCVAFVLVSFFYIDPAETFCKENGYDDSRSQAFRNSYCIKLVNDTIVTKDYNYYNGSYYWVRE